MGNAGYPQLEDAGVTYSDRPAEYAARFKVVASTGISYFEAGSGAGQAHLSAVGTMNKPHKPRVARGNTADALPKSERS
jgi:methionine synthase I (cobalamin-dependent)